MMKLIQYLNEEASKLGINIEKDIQNDMLTTDNILIWYSDMELEINELVIRHHILELLDREHALTTFEKAL